MNVSTLLMRQMEVHTSIRHPPRDAATLMELRQTIHDFDTFFGDLAALASKLGTAISTLFQCLLQMSVTDGDHSTSIASFDTQHGDGTVPMHQAKVIARETARQITPQLRRFVQTETLCLLVARTRALRSTLRVKVEDDNDLATVRRVVSDAMEYVDFIYAQSAGNAERMFAFYMVESGEALEQLLTLQDKATLNNNGAVHRRGSEPSVSSDSAGSSSSSSDARARDLLARGENNDNHEGVTECGNDETRTGSAACQISRETERDCAEYAEHGSGNVSACRHNSRSRSKCYPESIRPDDSTPQYVATRTSFIAHTLNSISTHCPSAHVHKSLSLLPSQSQLQRKQRQPQGSIHAAPLPTHPSCTASAPTPTHPTHSPSDVFVFSAAELAQYSAEAMNPHHQFTRRMHAAQAMLQIIVSPTRDEFARVAVEMTGGLSAAVEVLAQEKRSALCRIACDMIVALMQRLRETDSSDENKMDKRVGEGSSSDCSDAEGSNVLRGQDANDMNTAPQHNAGSSAAFRSASHKFAHPRSHISPTDADNHSSSSGSVNEVRRKESRSAAAAQTAAHFSWMHEVLHARSSQRTVGGVLGLWVSALVKGIFVTVAAISGATDRALRAMMRMSAGHPVVIRAVLSALDAGSQPELRRRCLGYLALGLSSAVASMTPDVSAHARPSITNLGADSCSGTDSSRKSSSSSDAEEDGPDRDDMNVEKDKDADLAQLSEDAVCTGKGKMAEDNSIHTHEVILHEPSEATAGACVSRQAVSNHSVGHTARALRHAADECAFTLHSRDTNQLTTLHNTVAISSCASGKVSYWSMQQLRAHDQARIDALLTLLARTPHTYVSVGSSACRRMARVLCAILCLTHHAMMVHASGPRCSASMDNTTSTTTSTTLVSWARFTTGMEDKVRQMIAQEMDRLAGVAHDPETLERVLFECADEFVQSTRRASVMENGSLCSTATAQPFSCLPQTSIAVGLAATAAAAGASVAGRLSAPRKTAALRTDRSGEWNSQPATLKGSTPGCGGELSRHWTRRCAKTEGQEASTVMTATSPAHAPVRRYAAHPPPPPPPAAAADATPRTVSREAQSCTQHGIPKKFHSMDCFKPVAGVGSAHRSSLDRASAHVPATTRREDANAAEESVQTEDDKSDHHPTTQFLRSSAVGAVALVLRRPSVRAARLSSTKPSFSLGKQATVGGGHASATNSDVVLADYSTKLSAQATEDTIVRDMGDAAMLRASEGHMDVDEMDRQDRVYDTISPRDQNTDAVRRFRRDENCPSRASSVCSSHTCNADTRAGGGLDRRLMPLSLRSASTHSLRNRAPPGEDGGMKSECNEESARERAHVIADASPTREEKLLCDTQTAANRIGQRADEAASDLHTRKMPMPLPSGKERECTDKPGDEQATQDHNLVAGRPITNSLRRKLAKS